MGYLGGTHAGEPGGVVKILASTRPVLPARVKKDGVADALKRISHAHNVCVSFCHGLNRAHPRLLVARI
jgi:hypothetical protein